MKKLKLWNGRSYGVIGSVIDSHINVAAYSRVDVRRLCLEAGLNDPGDTEIKEYWSECWGNSMSGITPERGIWLKTRGVVVQIYPKKDGDNNGKK